MRSTALHPKTEYGSAKILDGPRQLWHRSREPLAQQCVLCLEIRCEGACAISLVENYI